MITQFNCSCGANKPEDGKYYKGVLGYEAIVCRKCARLHDDDGEHEADEENRLYVGLPVPGKGIDVISPDGFSINREGIYHSHDDAYAAYLEWKKRFEPQGYYSSASYGRIPLEELEGYCDFQIINIEDEND